MKKFADFAGRKTAQEPRLNVLRGYVAWAQSSTASDRASHAEALGAARRALTFGEDWHFHYALADALWDIDDERGAAAEYEKAEALNPLNPTILFRRSQLMYERADAATIPDSAALWLSESRRDAQIALDIDATNERVRTWFDTLATLKWHPK